MASILISTRQVVMRMAWAGLALLALVVPGVPAAPPELPGVWDGTLLAGDQKIRLVVRVAARSGGGFAAVLDSPDQGAQGLGIDEVRVEGQAVSLVLARLRARFEGEINEAGTALTGAWSQGGASVPLTFTRTGPPPDPASLRPVDPDQVIPAKGVPGQGLVGRWGGVLSAGEIRVRLILAVRPGESGGLTATVENLDQGPIRLLVDSIRQNENVVSFEISRISGRYFGLMREDGSAIAGQWTQGGGPVDLVFRRLAPRP